KGAWGRVASRSSAYLFAEGSEILGSAARTDRCPRARLESPRDPRASARGPPNRASAPSAFAWFSPPRLALDPLPSPPATSDPCREPDPSEILWSAARTDPSPPALLEAPRGPRAPAPAQGPPQRAWAP